MIVVVIRGERKNRSKEDVMCQTRLRHTWVEMLGRQWDGRKSLVSQQDQEWSETVLATNTHVVASCQSMRKLPARRHNEQRAQARAQVTLIFKRPAEKSSARGPEEEYSLERRLCSLESLRLYWPVSPLV